MKVFTPENCARIIARVEAGAAFSDACIAAGVKVPTAETWLTRGRKEEEGPYAEFAQAIDAAKEEGQPMDEVELRWRVSQMVRGGNVQAAKLYWEMILDARKPTEASSEAPKDPLEGVDELAQRRTARA